MTTICSDGRTIAADGLATVGDEPIEYNVKKIFQPIGCPCVLGFVGDIRFRDPAVHWFMQGGNPELWPSTPDKEQYEWELLAFWPERVDVVSCRSSYWTSYPYPFSIGAGEKYAMGALLAGASPEEAIVIASRLNLYTGGRSAVLPIQGYANQEAAQ